MKRKRRLEIGYRSHKLVVVDYAPPLTAPSGRRYSAVLARCDCGTERVMYSSAFTDGTTQSCGCVLREKRAMQAYHAYVCDRITFAQAAERAGIELNTLRDRVEQGWSIQEAMTTPPKGERRK